MKKIRSTPTFALSAVAACFALGLAPSARQGESAAQASVAPDAELERRLERFCASIEEQRLSGHVPGLAVAVVRDDEVVLARGFGLARLEGEVPVTADTIFACGSTTKSFTAAAVALMVDAGRMDWDDPITQYLPYMELAVDTDEPDPVVTVRDLLSHRSGLGRMGILWGGGRDVPREAILQAAARAEPFGEFRKEFFYSNTMLLAAGVAAGVAADSTWDELVKTRLLEPLGMASSTLSIRGLDEDPRLAFGYLWNDESEAFEHKPMLDLDRLGPAGSLNSNVQDMARWLRFQLARGEFEGQRLLAAESVEEMWSPQIQMAPKMHYGMGWMLQERSGHRVVEHGGNIDGFSAQMALFPEDDLAYVLLANVGMTSLQQGSIGIFADTMLGDESGEEAGKEELELDEYLGTYIGNFGTFQDSEFQVLVQNDRLAVDVPGQTIYELKEPNEEGRWIFTLTDEIAVSFGRDENEAVVSLFMHQAGFDFELPRQGIEIAPEIPATRLQKYLGRYDQADGERSWEVVVQNGRLALDVPDQMVFELRAPDEEGRWTVRATDTMSLIFEEDAEARVAGFTFFQAGMELGFERVPTEGEPDLPTVTEVLALRRLPERLAARERLGGMRTTRTVWVVNSGAEGVETSVEDGNGRVATALDFGTFGVMRTVVGPTGGARRDSVRGYKVLEGRELVQTRLNAFATLDGDWRELFDRVEVVGRSTLDDREVFEVLLGHPQINDTTLSLDAETGDVLRARFIAQQEGMSIPIRMDFADYREVEGLRLPYEITLRNPFMGRLVTHLQEVETGLELGDEVFVLEPEAPGAKH